MLAKETKYSWYRGTEKKKLLPFFKEENSFAFCSDVPGLMKYFNVTYSPDDWRFFIDSSKRSLKGVLLHNGNNHPSLPIAHSVVLKESYDNIKLILQKVKYEDHVWSICGDFKVIGLLLGQQSGFTKFPCFLCEWDSRDRISHWEKKEWPSRQTFTPGIKNIILEPLIDPAKVLLPPLHIKLGLMKQFVRALDTNRPCFKYLCNKFPSLSYDKVKSGIFVGPQIRKLMLDSDFENVMCDLEKKCME